MDKEAKAKFKELMKSETAAKVKELIEQETKAKPEQETEARDHLELELLRRIRKLQQCLVQGLETVVRYRKELDKAESEYEAFDIPF